MENNINTDNFKNTNDEPTCEENGTVEEFCKNCDEAVCQPSAALKPQNNCKAFFKKHKKSILISFASLVLVIGLFFATEYLILSLRYSKAIKLMNDNNYAEAYYLLRDCYGFKDSAELLKGYKVISDKKTVTYYDKNGSLDYKLEYEYDENGNKTLEAKYNEDEKLEYDKNGNKTLFVNYNKDGSLFKWEYEYDKNSNLTLEARYDKNGNLEEKREFEFDKNGNLMLWVQYDENGNLYSKRECKYINPRVIYHPTDN